MTGMDAYGMYIEQPQHCGVCGAALKVYTSDRFDRQTGESLGATPVAATCPEGHEQWGRTMLGVWRLKP